MRKIFASFSFITLLLLNLMTGKAGAQLLSGYNQQFYTTVFDAAEGVAMPFLLQQGYKTMPGVTIQNDTTLLYNGQVYQIISMYQNPETGNPNGYYIEPALYGHYQIQIFTNVWPLQIPNVFYNPLNFSFSSLADCVGYGTRLLSAIGDTTEDGNAYLLLLKTIKTANTTHIAERGYVASAYEIGVAFPTLSDFNPNGWEYVSGNVIADSINAYNHRINPSVQQYNGTIKGGYSTSEPGDILAFAYAPGLESNGHFMVLTDEPYQINFDTVSHFYPHVPPADIQSFLNTYNVYATPVYDCSGKEAHFHDTRTIMSGIGHGILWILTDPSTDVPAGFIFEPPFDTVTAIRPHYIDDTYTWAISVGRYNGKGTNTGNNGTQVPSFHQLHQNYPNPFNPTTSIKFDLYRNEHVELKVHDLLGREVRTLVLEERAAGTHGVNFNAEGLPGGIYFVRISAGDFSQTRKIVLLK